MPKDVPFANYLEGIAYGCNVTLVDGLISDCARMVNEKKEKEGWFDISTLKEPFRVEGKKTMGYEVVEQLGWSYPDAIFYPTGGGVGLIGMWKAFEEMEQLGWVGHDFFLFYPVILQFRFCTSMHLGEWKTSENDCSTIYRMFPHFSRLERRS